jgi:NodT family efflux transporter outer membrane factor (OMF) lipoprotein
VNNETGLDHSSSIRSPLRALLFSRHFGLTPGDPRLNIKQLYPRQIAAGLSAALILSGCAAVGPNYLRPAVPVPNKWQSPTVDASASSVDNAGLAHWWRAFHDPVLDQLIQRALTNNKDLKQAKARLLEARARRGLAQADRFPTLGANASASRNGSSKELGSGLTSNQYTSGFDASWEMDIFGGKRRALEATSAQVEASEADLSAVQTSLTAEVGVNYLNLRAYAARLAVAQANLAIQTETRDIAQWRYQAGLTSSLDREQATSALEQTRAQIPVLETSLAQTKNQIAILLGINPQDLPPFATAPIPQADAMMNTGVPADLLRRRPDIRRAERQLAAQTAQVGVATAAQYPDFSLAGSIGLASLTSGNLFTAGARTFSIGSNASWTLFDAGRIHQNIQIQNALQAQALAQYESTVLTAFGEVENALIAYTREQERRAALTKAVAAAQSAEALARSQYAAGLIDFQSVLDTQRSLLTLQDLLVTSEAAVSSSLIQLYKALGGGWVANPPPTDHPSSSEITP